MGETGRIDGWKAIGTYLGRDRTTVMRWASKHAMPVHRLPGSGSSVFAFIAEIDDWLTRGGAAADVAPPLASPPAAAPQSAMSWHSRRFVIAVACVAVAGAGAVAVVPLLRGNRAATAVKGGIPLPEDPAVAAAYVQAREDWASRTGPGLRRAVGGFAQVIAHDPSFAPAYGGLADAYLLIREFDAVPEREAYTRAEAAARAALAVDPDSAEGHRALGFIAFWWHHDRRSTGREFSRALALDPRSGQTRLWLGNILMDNGQTREGLAQMSIARLLDPGSRAVQADYAWALWLSGDREQGRRSLETMAQRDPEFVSTASYLALIAMLEGDGRAYLANQRRRAAARADAPLAAQIEAASRAYAKGGQAGLLAVLVEAAHGDRDVADRGWEALMLALAGERARLLELIETADKQNRWVGSPPMRVAMERYTGDAQLMQIWRSRLSEPIRITGPGASL